MQRPVRLRDLGPSVIVTVLILTSGYAATVSRGISGLSPAAAGAAAAVAPPDAAADALLASAMFSTRVRATETEPPTTATPTTETLPATELPAGAPVVVTPAIGTGPASTPLTALIGKSTPATDEPRDDSGPVPFALKVARPPVTPIDLPTAIEPLATYVGQTACQVGFRTGTATLARLLAATYPGTTSGGEYACGTDGIISEHYDGRAIDWMNSVRDPGQAGQADAVLHWLLDTDAAGNKFAMARRLGVMYVIWNNRIWGAWDGRWAPYENCAQQPGPGSDSYCHRNHIHISLSWDGAFGRTSFFTRHVVSTTDFGPCRAKDLNWAGPYTGPNRSGCTVYPKLSPPAGTPEILAGLLSWSGDEIATSFSRSRHITSRPPPH